MYTFSKFCKQTISDFVRLVMFTNYKSKQNVPFFLGGGIFFHFALFFIFIFFSSFSQVYAILEIKSTQLIPPLASNHPLQ